MTKKDWIKKVAEYEELKKLVKEAEAEAAKLEAEFKKELDKKGVTELEVGDKKVRWTPFVTKRFDSKGFQIAEPELYKAYTKEVESRRFSVA